MIENKKGITLIELLIAATLLGLIMTAATAIDFTNRMALIRGVKKVDASGKARYALEHMTRHIRLANEVSGGGTNIVIRSDYDLSTGLANKTPSRFTDDWEAEYGYQAASEKLSYRYRSPGFWGVPGPWSSWEDIATGVASCNFTVNDNGVPPSVDISITVTSGTESISLDTTVGLWCKGSN